MTDAEASGFDDIIAGIKAAASSAPSLDDLRATRSLVTSAAFGDQLAEIIARSHNQPNERAAMAGVLTETKFAFRDQLAGRVEQHSTTALVSIGGGAALSVSAMLAIATQLVLYPPLVIVPLAAGVYFGWRGAETNKRLALEISTLNDIIEALDGHIRSVTRDD